MNDILEPTPGDPIHPVPDGLESHGPRENDGFFGRLTDLIVKPTRLMRNVGVAPRWWQPGLLIFAVMVVFQYFTYPIAAPEQVEIMRNSRMAEFMPPEALEQAYLQALDPSPAKLAIESVKVGVTTWVMVLVVSVIFGFFAKMGGGKGKMKQALGIVHWASVLPFALFTLIKLPLVLATETVLGTNLGLAALLPDPDPGSALFQILVQYGDFGSWWGLFVMITGFKVVYRMSGVAAATSILLPWVLAVAVPTVIAILFV